MSLLTEVQGRFSAQRLVELTNPEEPDATTYDATRLDYACTDVAGEFEIYAGVALDATVASHLAVAVDGVVLLLQKRLRGGAQVDQDLKDWRDRLRDLSKVTGRDRILPDTDGILEPTPDESGAQPYFDRSVFTGVVPRAPQRGGSDPDAGDS